MTRSIAAIALVLAGCGHRAAAAPPAAPAAEDEWSKASWVERHATMTFTVLPNMARLFQAAQHKPNADLTCRTCHGDRAEEVDYRMPAEHLRALDPEHLPRADSPDAREAAMARFMNEKVVPEMKELIGTPHVGCFSCHPRSKR